MSKLVIFAVLTTQPENGASEHFRCTFPDELRFSSRIGETIIIADITPGMGQGYIAIGQLRGFVSDANGTLVRVEKISTFPSVVPFYNTAEVEQKISEVADDAFERIIATAVGAGSDEGDFAHNQVSRDAFSAHLRRARSQRCGFSDVATEQGEAFLIQPPEHGGKWHTSNFIFLDQQPGILFVALAWTVGPRFEIIIDSCAAGIDILESVNPTGMLAISDTIAAWPDRDALAWHRERFFDRLRG